MIVKKYEYHQLTSTLTYEIDDEDIIEESLEVLKLLKMNVLRSLISFGSLFAIMIMIVRMIFGLIGKVDMMLSGRLKILTKSI